MIQINENAKIICAKSYLYLIKEFKHTLCVNVQNSYKGRCEIEQTYASAERTNEKKREKHKEHEQNDEKSSQVRQPN